MEINTNKQELTINRLITHRKETFIVEGDIIVPDVKPDVLNTININGNVCIYKKELFDGKIKLEGSTNLYIIYLADSQSDFTRGINTEINFSKMIDIPEIKQDMILELRSKINNSEARVLNGRKINIRTILELEITVFSNEKIQILKTIDNIDDIQKYETKKTINTLVGLGSSKIIAKDTLTIDEDKSLSEILSAKVSIINKETKTSYNKVLLKADANVKMLYLTDEGTIELLDSNIPIMGFIDINDISEENIITSNYEIKNIILKPNSIEEHSVYVEIEIEASCIAYDVRHIELIQDIYSPSEDISYDVRKIEAMTNKDFKKCNYNIKEKISDLEIANNKIYNVDIKPNITNQKISNNKIIYEGEVELSFILSLNNTSGVDFKEYKIPFNFSENIENINNTRNINTTVECISNDINIGQDGEINCSLELEFNISMSSIERINIIDEIKATENRTSNPYSLIIYFVKKGDTLWSIAKKYKTTIEEIAKLNNLENLDKLEIGQKLLIARFCKNRIECTA